MPERDPVRRRNPSGPEPASIHREEAELVYRAVFGQVAPEPILARFAEVAPRLERGTPADELARCRAAIRTASDLEALEFACRVSGRMELLTRKTRTVVRLAETLPDHQHHFISRDGGLFTGFFVLCRGGVRGAWKLARGWWILRTLSDG